MNVDALCYYYNAILTAGRFSSPFKLGSKTFSFNFFHREIFLSGSTSRPQFLVDDDEWREIWSRRKVKGLFFVITLQQNIFPEIKDMRT